MVKKLGSDMVVMRSGGDLFVGGVWGCWGCGVGMGGGRGGGCRGMGLRIFGNILCVGVGIW